MTTVSPATASRISKLAVDRNEVSFEEADRRRAAYRVALAAGPDVAHLPTIQAALLTAANTLARCFPGGVSFHAPKGFDPEVLVRFPIRSLTAAIYSLGVTIDSSTVPDVVERRLVFGTRPDVGGGLQVTFDGWIGAVGPAADGVRLREREGCILAGVLAGGMAVGEEFLRFAKITQMAGHRPIGLSLWRPDLAWNHEEAIGPAALYATSEYWLLGLGHLGQAFLWSIGLLPFAEPAAVNVMLQDFDKVEEANVGTGLLTVKSDLGTLKTRVAERWLKQVGIVPRVVDRAFDEHVQRTDAEPRLALCGFDARGPRWTLEKAGFSNVINCGLGGRADDFETIVMHTLPHPEVKAEVEWPVGWGEREAARVERLAHSNKIYQAYSDKLRCGEIELAGRAVAVPFVGAVAGSLVVAETLRMQQGGVRCGSARVQLDASEERIIRCLGTYTGPEQPLLAAQALKQTDRIS